METVSPKWLDQGTSATHKDGCIRILLILTLTAKGSANPSTRPSCWYLATYSAWFGMSIKQHLAAVKKGYFHECLRSYVFI